MKNVSFWGGGGREEECNLWIKREASFYSALLLDKHQWPSSPSQKCALWLSPNHTTCSQSWGFHLLSDGNRAKANPEEITFLRWKILLSLRVIHENQIWHRNRHSKLTGKYSPQWKTFLCSWTEFYITSCSTLKIPLRSLFLKGLISVLMGLPRRIFSDQSIDMSDSLDLKIR